MAQSHWSRDMATLWWRDKGTGRMRVSFHADAGKLKSKYEKLYHENIDAALYNADGTRVPLSALPMGGAKKRKSKKPKAPAQEAAKPVAA